MKDIEKQVEEMEKELDNFCLDIDSECEVKCSKCLANFLIREANYRKMDEVTLKLDLGDRTPEEIKLITEMFNGEIKKQVAKEILQAVDEESNGQTLSVTNYLRKKYGVEID